MFQFNCPLTFNFVWASLPDDMCSRTRHRVENSHLSHSKIIRNQQKSRQTLDTLKRCSDEYSLEANTILRDKILRKIGPLKSLCY